MRLHRWPWAASTVAALVIMAVAASAASAKPFLFYATVGATRLTVLTDGPLPKWGADFGTVECTGESGEGEVESEASEEEVAVSFSGCHAGAVPVKIDGNGCEFGFKAEEFENGNYEGNMEVRCPAGQVLEFTGTGCTIRVTPQIGLKKVTYTTIGFNLNQEVTVALNVSGVAYE